MTHRIGGIIAELTMGEMAIIPLFPKTTLANRDILPTESLFMQIEIELSNKETGYLEKDMRSLQ